jgi:hypothetical protein
LPYKADQTADVPGKSAIQRSAAVPRFLAERPLGLHLALILLLPQSFFSDLLL